MKSVAVLGIGVIALTAGVFITAGAAGKEDRVPVIKRSSYFEASVAGGMSAQPAGAGAFGVVGDSASSVAAFSISLDGRDSSGAILFTSLDGRMPSPGRYQLSDTATTGFRAMYIAGSAERPTALFRAERGTLEITSSSPDRLSGHFSFTGAGFQASDPTDEGSEVTINGAFMSTGSPAAGADTL
jgi:hypothetical protein